MNVGSLMRGNPVSISISETFEAAYRVMTGQRLAAIPIVDAAGVYQGMFHFGDVLELLLPRAAMLGLDSLTDLSFVSNAGGQLREKLREAGPRPISEFLDAKAPPVHPDTPLKEAILLFHRHNTSLPVVERGTRRLVGLISPWDLLDGLQ